jgi:hypothetical protein
MVNMMLKLNDKSTIEIRMRLRPDDTLFGSIGRIKISIITNDENITSANIILYPDDTENRINLMLDGVKYELIEHLKSKGII